MSTTFKFGSLKLTKWQLALLVGTPLAIGMGVYVYKKMNASIGENDDKKQNSKKTLDLKKQSLSIDGTSEDKELEKKKKKVELENEKLSPLKEATMFKNEGNTCYRSGKFDEAISFYDKAIDKCPRENKTDLAIFYQNRAASYEMLRKWAKVKEDCTKSLECNPRYAKAFFRRAKAFEATCDMYECLDDITATCVLEMFQNNNTIMYADRILKQTGREDADKGMKDKVPLLPSSSFITTYLRSFVSDPLQTMRLPESVTIKEKLYGFVRAKVALDEQNYEEVIASCTEEIESSESESQYKTEALLLRGTFHLLSGSFSEAKQDLDAVILNDDADTKYKCYALIRRASYFIQLEEKVLGLDDFSQAQKLEPENPDLYHQRAQIYILLDQLPDALQDFEKAIKLAPHNAMAFVQKCYAEYRLALLSQDQMRLMMVMNEFKNAVEKFPDCVECYSLMAQVLSDQQQFQQADQFYEKAIKLAPDNASLLVHRGIMTIQWMGDIEKSLGLIQKAIEVDDKCELAYETLGTIEVQRANLDRAVDLFEKAIKLAKSYAEMCHLYALRNAAVAQINVTRKLGMDMSTISALAQADDADTKYKCYALIRRASYFIQLEEKVLGLDDFSQAQKLEPENPDLYHQRAQIYILLDQLPDALQDFEKAIKLAPHNAMAFVQKCYAEYRLALLSQDQMRLMMVMNEFKNAVEKFPDCVECYSLMAQVLSDQQQFQQADQFYEKAIKLAPDNASLLVHRGIMTIQWMGDIEKSLGLIQKAIEVDDKCELAYETLGTIEVQRANLDRAVDLFEKAIKLAKSYAEMCHLYALRNAAVAQINVTRKLGMDMSTISALAQAGIMPPQTSN